MNNNPSSIKELYPDLSASQLSSQLPGTHLNQTTISSAHDQRSAGVHKNVAPFLNKVYIMVNDPSTDDLIHWSADGKSFFVVRHEDFARSVLPRFFKHSNFSSFVRQLNMYGFHKVPHLQNGVLLSDNDSEQWEFSNPHFQRNQPDLLLLVTRKKGRETDEKDGSAAHGNSTSSNGSSNSSHIDLHRILEEIQVIKQHQMNISSQLKSIQSDNSILWQETISARERHQRHQETIDKILRFLASVFSNDKSVAIPRKRRFLLEAPEQDGTMDSRRQEQQDGSHNDDKANERPAKAQKTKPAPEFKLEDYVPGLNGQTGNSSSSSTTQPQNPTSELADAIASNDKSKQSTSSSSSSSSVASWIYPMSLPQDLTQVMNSQQIQGLQSLISLAQSHPALLSQLTTDVVSTYHQGNLPTTTNNNTSTTTPATKPSNPAFDPAILHDNNVIATIPPSDPSQTGNTSSNDESHQQQTNGAPTKPSLPQISNNIRQIACTADDINTGIDMLGSNIEALAHQLGFDPTKSDDDLLGYVDMDKFMQEYGPTDGNDNVYPTETISPATTTPASPNNTDNTTNI